MLLGKPGSKYRLFYSILFCILCRDLHPTQKACLGECVGRLWLDLRPGQKRNLTHTTYYLCTAFRSHNELSACTKILETILSGRFTLIYFTFPELLSFSGYAHGVCHTHAVPSTHQSTLLVKVNSILSSKLLIFKETLRYTSRNEKWCHLL